jgi:hypothetical protein
MCGATSGQKAIANDQSGFFKTLMTQAQGVFGNASNVFKDLMNTFSPVVEAGPNQRGFSAPERAALESGAITNVGNQYRNASQAVKQANAAVGGGNMALPSGADIGKNLSVANAGAQETASELNKINLEDFATGRQNYLDATKGMLEAPGVFQSANQSGNVATGAGEGAASSQNQIAQANNSWVNAAFGALGQIGGAAMTGGMSLLKPGGGASPSGTTG